MADISTPSARRARIAARKVAQQQIVQHRVLDPSLSPRVRAGSCALAIMTKAPRAGEVKTRLIPPLTSEEAADLNVCFLRDITAGDRASLAKAQTRLELPSIRRQELRMPITEFSRQFFSRATTWRRVWRTFALCDGGSSPTRFRLGVSD